MEVKLYIDECDLEVMITNEIKRQIADLVSEEIKKQTGLEEAIEKRVNEIKVSSIDKLVRLKVAEVISPYINILKEVTQ